MNLFESHHEACMNCTSFVEIEGVVVDVNHFKYEHTYILLLCAQLCFSGSVWQIAIDSSPQKTDF